MVDDGNCQFRALSEECWGTPRYHYAVRLRACEYMEANSDQFACYFPENEWADYLRKMRMRRTWGDELSLRAAAEVLKCSVYVVTSESENWLLNYAPGDQKGSAAASSGPVRSLFLTYVSPIHYNTCEPKTTELSDGLGAEGVAIVTSGLRKVNLQLPLTLKLQPPP